MTISLINDQLNINTFSLNSIERFRPLSKLLNGEYLKSLNHYELLNPSSLPYEKLKSISPFTSKLNYLTSRTQNVPKLINDFNFIKDHPYLNKSLTFAKVAIAVSVIGSGVILGIAAAVVFPPLVAFNLILASALMTLTYSGFLGLLYLQQSTRGRDLTGAEMVLMAGTTLPFTSAIAGLLTPFIPIIDYFSKEKKIYSELNSLNAKQEELFQAYKEFSETVKTAHNSLQFEEKVDQSQTPDFLLRLANIYDIMMQIEKNQDG